MGVGPTMRSLFLVFLTLAAASAIPSADVVPEEALVQYPSDYEHAKQHLQTLLEAGKNDKECRDLATASKKAVEEDVTNDQKILDALPDGSNCKDEGQGLVTSSKSARDKADKDESDAKKKLDKAAAVNVDFGSIPYNTLVPGQCGTFFNHANYKAAKSALDAAQKAHDKAKGTKAAAQKAFDDALAAASKAKDECLCKTKKAHDAAWAEVKKSAPKTGVDWKTAHNLLCVLDGTAVSKCVVPPEPKVKQPKIVAAAAAMDGKKCSLGGVELIGYNAITLAKNNKIGKVNTDGKFEVSFDIYPTSTRSGWGNIVHFTQGGNCCSPGQRIPAVWFISNTYKMHVRDSTLANGNDGCDPSQALVGNKWQQVTIRNDGTTNGFVVSLDGKAICSKTLKPIANINNVEVWAGDPWHEVAHAKMRNLIYKLL